jgi:hypothetical protein
MSGFDTPLTARRQHDAHISGRVRWREPLSPTTPDGPQNASASGRITSGDPR